MLNLQEKNCKKLGIKSLNSNKMDYWGLLQPQQRFQDDETARGGFKNLMFNGVPVIVDSHVSSGDMNFLNENYLNIRYHKDENFRFEPFQKPINITFMLIMLVLYCPSKEESFVA